MISSSRRLLLVVALIGVGLVSTLVWLALRQTDPPGALSSTPTPGQGAALREAARVTVENGPYAVKVHVAVGMPPGFDDGLAEREFKGEGVADFRQNVARIDYAVGDVPNTAGYFGHVDGDMPVIYEGPRFLLTFPAMAEVLEGDVEWMSYQLSDLSLPEVLALGIGQLREIGLADPRIGVALASTGLDGASDLEGPHPIDLARAMTLVPAEIRPALEELQARGVQQVILSVQADDSGSLRGYAYELVYPPGRKAEPTVSLSVRVAVGEPAPSGSVEVPTPSTIQPYLDYLGIR